jgi:hypothetical protein
MGSSPYWYYVPYEENRNDALMKLRDREFIAGRYNPVVMFPKFPVTEKSISPGKKHGSIEMAMEDAGEDGTRSILDLAEVSENDDFCTARILSTEELTTLFGTDKPAKEMIEKNTALFEGIERGKGVCITVYEKDKPKELFFMGYSFD